MEEETKKDPTIFDVIAKEVDPDKQMPSYRCKVTDYDESNIMLNMYEYNDVKYMWDYVGHIHMKWDGCIHIHIPYVYVTQPYELWEHQESMKAIIGSMASLLHMHNTDGICSDDIKCYMHAAVHSSHKIIEALEDLNAPFENPDEGKRP